MFLVDDLNKCEYILQHRLEFSFGRRCCRRTIRFTCDHHHQFTVDTHSQSKSDNSMMFYVDFCAKHHKTTKFMPHKRSNGDFNHTTQVRRDINCLGVINTLEVQFYVFASTHSSNEVYI